MDSARWERLQDLFHRALELPDGARADFLAGACGDDLELAAEVRAMLEADAGESLLDRELAAVAGAVLGPEGPMGVPSDAFGPYRAVRLLGEGGMGVVYLGERTDLGTRVAIKILRDGALSPHRRERFASEARLLAGLDHPAIARLFDAGTLPDGTPWIVMEFVEGRPLVEHCEARHAPLAERLRLFRSACEAVEHAHGQAIIHRDLKPSNILVREDGTLKLLDFGVARRLAGPGGASDPTRTGWRALTPAYAAPEQVRGEPVGTRADIYALGVVLYELLVGRPPFDLATRTPAEAERIVSERDPEPPSVAARAAGTAGRLGPVSRAAWAELDVVCLTAMRKEPERRYPTVEALARDLERFARGEPLSARPDSAGYRVGKFVRRHRWPLAAAAVAILTLGALIAFYTLRLANARNAALAEAARTQRIQRFMSSLFTGGEDAAGPADSLRVVTLLARGEQEAGALAGEPAVQAELIATLGGIYHSLGHLERAESLLIRALALRRALPGPPPGEVARGLVSLGDLRVDQARYAEAESLAREALALHGRVRPEGDEAERPGLVVLGRSLLERGRYDEAVTVLERAVALPVTDPADPGVARGLYELANTHFYAGRFTRADSLNEVALAMVRRVRGERHPAVADNLINLGATRFERGRYEEAEGYYRRALEITRGWHGEDHPRTASHLTMLGRALVFQEHHDEALAVLRRALAIQERVHGPSHPAVASALNELGSVALQRGSYDEAQGYYARMVTIYREVYGARHYLLGVAVSNLGSVASARGDHPRAEDAFREALDQFLHAQGPRHLNTGIARIKLGRALLRQGRHAEARGETRAGYEVLTGQTDPRSGFLKAARSDLVAIHEALGERTDAGRMRAEIAALDPPASP